MCSPTAAISGGLGVAQAYAGYQGQQASVAANNRAIRARNRAARMNYHAQIQRQNQEWNNTLKIWNQRIEQYHKQIQRNNDAAYGYGGAYMGLQVKTNEAFRQAAFQSQGALTKLYQTMGTAAATGQTGRTADRFDVASLAAFGREQAIRTSNLTRTIEGQKLDQTNVRRQLENANNQAYQSVAVAPVPGMRPLAPVMDAPMAAPSAFGAIVQGGTALFGAAQKGGLFGIGAQDAALGIKPGNDFTYGGSTNIFRGANLGSIAGINPF